MLLVVRMVLACVRLNRETIVGMLEFSHRCWWCVKLTIFGEGVRCVRVSSLLFLADGDVGERIGNFLVGVNEW